MKGVRDEGEDMNRDRKSVQAAIGFSMVLVAISIVMIAVTVSSASSERSGSAASRLGPYPAFTPCTIFPASTAAPTDPSGDDETAWKQNISQAPVDPMSDTYMGYINKNLGANLHPDFGTNRAYGIPYAVVGAGGKTLPVNIKAYKSESDKGKYRIPKTAPVENGSGSDGDRHVLVIDKSRCILQELYRAFLVKNPKPHFNADGAVLWNLRSPARRTEGFTSADAGGLPIFPGLVRFDEVQSGAIKHAIRLTFSATQDAWIHPASHCAGATSNPAAPPLGLRMRLKANYPTGNFTGDSLVIATALKNYGFILADNGSDWYFSGTSDKRWPNNNLNQLKDIPGSAFEVVDSAAPVQPC